MQFHIISDFQTITRETKIYNNIIGYFDESDLSNLSVTYDYQKRFLLFFHTIIY